MKEKENKLFYSSGTKKSNFQNTQCHYPVAYWVCRPMGFVASNYCIIGFVAYWVCRIMGCRLLGFSHYVVCHLLGCSPYGVCRLLGLPHYGICRLSNYRIIGFVLLIVSVADGICCSTSLPLSRSLAANARVISVASRLVAPADGTLNFAGEYTGGSLQQVQGEPLEKVNEIFGKRSD